jgi:hypothetical protein
MVALMRPIDYGDDPERLKGIVLEHLLRDAVLYEAPVFSTGLVGEVQDTLHHLAFCRPERPAAADEEESRRYVGTGWTASGHEVRATFYFQWKPVHCAFGAVPYAGGSSFLKVHSAVEC